jgi:hypothetical protein
MDPIRLIHIAPELPPTVGGLADYATILNQRLIEVSDGALEPVMVHAGKAPAETIEVACPVADVSGSRSAAILANAIRGLTDDTDDRTVVLLEYSGYGYAKRGAPLWLARGLRQVCGENGVPLLTMFHEISASSWKPWTSTFWLSPLQSWVARQIAQCSVGMMTTHPTGAETLRQFVDANTPVNVCPVFSNVGEPEERPTFEARAPQAVIFGGSRTKTALYDTHRDATQTALENWAIDTVIDVGPSDAVVLDALETKVNIRGLQPARTISNLLLDARIGLLHYPAAYATKSGILAAYMAHGVVPVLVAPEPFGGRLKAGTHFVVPKLEVSTAATAEHASRWYDRHAHSRIAARRMLQLIEKTLKHPVIASQ